MRAERKDAIRSVLEMIREDVKADVARREGMPLSGRAVGQALGEICAQVDALANITLALLDEVVIEPRPTIVNQQPPYDEVECCASGSCEVCRR